MVLERLLERMRGCVEPRRRTGIPAAESLEHDRKHHHMATAETGPLWFVSFDALTKIILDDVLCPRFEPYLTTKKLVDAKVDEIKVIRNRVAHARSLHDDDLERLTRVLRDFDRRPRG